MATASHLFEPRMLMQVAQFDRTYISHREDSGCTLPILDPLTLRHARKSLKCHTNPLVPSLTSLVESAVEINLARAKEVCWSWFAFEPVERIRSCQSPRKPRQFTRQFTAQQSPGNTTSSVYIIRWDDVETWNTVLRTPCILKWLLQKIFTMSTYCKGISIPEWNTTSREASTRDAAKMVAGSRGFLLILAAGQNTKASRLSGLWKLRLQKIISFSTGPNSWDRPRERLVDRSRLLRHHARPEIVRACVCARRNDQASRIALSAHGLALQVVCERESTEQLVCEARSGQVRVHGESIARRFFGRGTVGPGPSFHRRSRSHTPHPLNCLHASRDQAHRVCNRHSEDGKLVVRSRHASGDEGQVVLVVLGALPRHAMPCAWFDADADSSPDLSPATVQACCMPCRSSARFKPRLHEQA
ncbi:uncharacterized protein MYCFIDRAFT_173730 [Pseudocercospora fijiensis CIRAD86]|uniref:Uncharacterized protein n=1 Tax=Pseudocercospora fijiensis (strain CIRAD86) TaxID=383855 RepID=M3A0Z1_PSEFD|nr:uncharacterized protein MYCFIDRAFT_173730 [Pseudocercospora fijiensis CIRAD86]EME84809.1 hypothetical protein MYCFIDRAFT_173730 [Pseudocercospora fijiensis CIRAD86]